MTTTSTAAPRRSPRALLGLAALVLAVIACGDDASDPGDAGNDASQDASQAGRSGASGRGGTSGMDGSAPACSDDDDCPPLMACVRDECRDCVNGEQNCLCRTNESCDEELLCEQDVCVPCAGGELGCACNGDACADDLACVDDLCTHPSCEAGARDCPCRPDEPRCDDDDVCAGSLCVACTPDTPGCPCEEDACTGGLVCEAGLCRRPLTCGELDPPCADGEGCLPEGRGRDAACAPCSVAGNCPGSGTCAVTASGSLAAECAAQHRICVESDTGATCGACWSVAAEQAGECVVDTTCGGASCADGEYCDATASGGPACASRPCAPDQAQRGDGQCIACTQSCTDPGATGRYWPFASGDGTCVCETAPGYFLAAGGSGRPELCDADGDGWARSELGDTRITSDPAYARNARCAVRTVDRVRLVDEYGGQLVVHSCDTGLETAACTGPVLPLRLLESQRNDVPTLPDDSEIPAYGSVRRLRAAEVNTLTKACSTELADFNDAGGEDIDEVQQPDLLGESDRLLSFAHFIELYRSRYEAGAPHGMLVIEERSRCSASSFPLAFGGAGEYATEQADTYWRSCYRRRAASYDADEPGYDFASFSCAGTSGSCPAGPPAHPTRDLDPAPPDWTTQELLRGHGLCELGAAAPADGVFRGLHHHSQFQCVHVVGAAPASTRDWTTAQLAGGFSACRAEAGSSGSPPAQTPVLACESTTPAVGAVGWARVGYSSYDPVGSGPRTYARGCVREDVEWPYLCPAPRYEPIDASDAFGRYSCYGTGPLFLWAADTGGESRLDVLKFAPDTGSGGQGILGPETGNPDL